MEELDVVRDASCLGSRKITSINVFSTGLNVPCGVIVSKLKGHIDREAYCCQTRKKVGGLSRT